MSRALSPFSAAFLLSVLFSSVGCDEEAPEEALTSLERDDLEVTLTASDGLVVERGGEVLWSSYTDDPTHSGDDPLRPGDAYAPFATAVTETRYVDETFGFFRFRDTVAPFVALTPEQIVVETDRISFRFAQGGEGEVEIAGDGAVHVSWEVPESLGDRQAMTFPCREGERFYGAGAQVSAEHRGHRVPIWTQEQGVGKTDQGEPTSVFGLIGAHYDAYAPIPFTLTDRPGGVWLNSRRWSEFEFCQDGDRLRIETWGPRFDLWIFPTDTMAAALTAFTRRTGRPDPVSRWTLAPWIDIMGGPAAIATHVATLRAEGIPASAVWSEDWVGTLQAMGGENLTYDWVEDPARFPDLGGVAANLHDQGLRFLVYVNPFIPDDAEVYDDLVSAGALVKDADGEELVISFPFGEPPRYFDPTSSLGVAVFEAFMERAIGLGVDGWMADYGEALPWEAVLDDGQTGPEAHNLFPILWAQTSKDFWEAHRPGDFGTFTRSGHTGIAAAAHVMWLGDQNTSWDRNDGLGSVMPLYLSAGLSGIALTHSDVGGYANVGTDSRDFELWARWLELEAFTPILRTHHGSSPGQNVQWYTDAQTLGLFNTYARWHQRLVPYFATLTQEATDTGTPAVRPIWWGAEAEADLLEIDDALLVGADLLLAPIVTPGAITRSVQLPPGAWRRWRAFAEPLEAPEQGAVIADAPVEEAVVYLRAGAAMPLLTRDYDSLVTSRAEITVDAAIDVAPDVIAELALLLVAGGEGAVSGALDGYTFQGTAWTWDGSALSSGPLTGVAVAGSALPACAGASDLDCIDGAVARLGPTSLDGGEITVSAGSATGTLTVTSDGLAELWIELR